MLLEKIWKYINHSLQKDIFHSLLDNNPSLWRKEKKYSYTEQTEVVIQGNGCSKFTEKKPVLESLSK